MCGLRLGVTSGRMGRICTSKSSQVGVGQISRVRASHSMVGTGRGSEWVGNDTRRESNNDDNDNDKRASGRSGRDDGGVCTRTESRIPGAVEAAAVLGAGAGAGAGAGCSSCVAVCVAALTDVMFRGPGSYISCLIDQVSAFGRGLGGFGDGQQRAAWEQAGRTDRDGDVDDGGNWGKLGVDGRR